jgi:hypothetical protein
VGAGCLILAIGMFSLFVKPLRLPHVMRVESFHSLKGQFANFVILAMAVSFLESLSNLQALMRDPGSNGSEIFFAGAGMALVTLALLAFKYWGGEPRCASSDSLSHGLGCSKGTGGGQGESGGVMVDMVDEGVICRAKVTSKGRRTIGIWPRTPHQGTCFSRHVLH